MMKMKTLLIWAACAVSFLAIAVPIPTDRRITTVKGEKRGHSVSRGELSGCKSGIVFRWKPDSGPFGEIVFCNPPQLGHVPAVLSLALHAPKKVGFKELRLRIADSSGETFEFRPFRDSERMEFKLSVEGSDAHWGGDNNGRIDGKVSLVGFAVVFQTPNPGGELILGDFELFHSELDAIHVGIDTGESAAIILPEHETTAALTFETLGDHVITCSVTCNFEDFFGRKFQKAKKLELVPGRIERLPFGPLPARGWWKVSYQLSDQSRRKSSGELSFAAIVPSGPTPGISPGFVFGVHSHWRLCTAHEKELEAKLAAWAGIKALRYDIQWRDLHPTPNSPWSFQDVDAALKLCCSYGIELEALLGAPPAWAEKPGYTRPRPDIGGEVRPQTDLYREYIRKVAEHYKGRIRFYEQFNEPDLASFYNFGAEEYVELFRAGAEEIRKADPTAKRLTGGFATMRQVASSHGPDYLKKALAGTKGHFDIQAHHEHGTFEEYVQMMENHFLPLRHKLGITEPWYATETALSAVGGQEKLQAATLWQKLLFAWSRGAIAYNWYDLRNDGFDPVNGEHNYGLLTNDFRPKPVYVAYNTLTGLFRTQIFVRQLPASAGIWLLEFRNAKKQLLAAWHDNRTSSMTFLFKTNAKAGELTDLMGNRQQITVRNNYLPLEIGKFPVALEVPADSELIPAGQLIKTDFSGAVAPGKEFSFRLQLFNPSNRVETFILETGVPAGIKISPAHTEITLQADTHQEITLSGTVDRNFRVPPGSSEHIVIVVSGNWNCRLELPLHIPVIIPIRRNGIIHDFILNKREQVHSLIGADPSREHLNWKGPEDLSATARLSQDGQNFILAVDVTDDRHCQPFSGSGVWQGDCVQFAIAVPEHSGLWEIGLTRRDDGKNEVFCWSTPDGLDPAPVMKTAVLKTERDGNRTSYQVSIPLTALKLSPKLLRQGFRFNLLINDNDGEGRENWIHIVPGIGESKTPEQYPLVVFE